MRSRIPFFLLIVFFVLASKSVIAQELVPGTFKVVSFVLEVDGTATEFYGNAPRGFVVLTPERFIGIVTAEGRKFGTTIDEKAVLWDSMIAYSGRYEVDGDKLIISVDVSYNERWNGTKILRYWNLSGNLLTLTSPPAPWSKDPSKTASARVVFERVE
jgi:Lipocalin-like domain